MKSYKSFIEYMLSILELLNKQSKAYLNTNKSSATKASYKSFIARSNFKQNASS